MTRHDLMKVSDTKKTLTTITPMSGKNLALFYDCHRIMFQNIQDIFISYCF